MPITASAKKALRQSKRRRVRNLARRAAVRAAAKKYQKLIKGDRAAAAQFLSQVYQAIDKAAKTGYLKRNTAARMKSRMAKKLATSH